MKRHLILGECKWTNQREKTGVLRDLVERKTVQLIPPGEWEVYYLGFSRAGWNGRALAYADALNETKPEEQIGGSRWRVAGMRLLSLADVDSDLENWS
jgi:hypothetical protein